MDIDHVYIFMKTCDRTTFQKLLTLAPETMNPSAELFRNLPPSFCIASAVKESTMSTDSWIHGRLIWIKMHEPLVPFECWTHSLAVAPQMHNSPWIASANPSADLPQIVREILGFRPVPNPTPSSWSCESSRELLPLNPSASFRPASALLPRCR